MWTKQKEKALIKWSLILIPIFAIVMWGSVIIRHELKPRIDYEAMHEEMMNYVDQLENIKEFRYVADGVYDITLEDSSWYSGYDRDKRGFCLNVNQSISYYCWKYKAAEEPMPAYIHYYDESGVLIAEPGRLGSFESEIIH